MKADASHIRQVKVVSNTHWDREFRRSFEKTRRRLLTMVDVTLDILQSDPACHSLRKGPADADANPRDRRDRRRPRR